MSQQALSNANNLMRQGSFTQAIAEFQKVHRQNPKSVEAFKGAALCYAQLKQWREAFNCILNALELTNNRQAELVVFIEIITASALQSYFPSIEKALKACLSSPWLAGKASQLLVTQFYAKYQALLSKSSPVFDDNLVKMLHDETLHLILAKQLITNYALENRLYLARTELLIRAMDGYDIDSYRPFLSALVCQSLLNDDLYDVTPAESKKLALLIEDNGEQLNSLLLQLCYADFAHTMRLWQQHKQVLKASQLTDLINDLTFYHKVFAVNNTNKNSELNDNTSKIVQSFYADNPYPKWKTLVTSSISIADIFNQLGKTLSKHSTALIAGCGTGKQAIEMALANPKVKITAIDLSPTSLAFARLMAKRYKVSNVTFLLHDILAVKALKRDFDFVLCTGVLHHMAVPQSGLNRLAKVLKPNGIMLLGFYSQLARLPFAKIRDNALKYLGYQPAHQGVTQAEVSRWRGQLSEAEQQHSDINIEDFFYLNGLMDLLFHPQQAEYDLLTLQDMLNRAGLHFDSMALSNQLKAHYADDLQASSVTTKPQTLSDWHQFELDHPDFFKAMFNFFVTKD